MDSLQENLNLAKQLGYDGVAICHTNFDGSKRYFWNGLEVPEESVRAAEFNETRSGIYPWYLKLMKEKGLV